MVIGGGTIGAKKAIAFAEAGAAVNVIAPRLLDELAHHARIITEARGYRGPSDIEGADLVVAATDSEELNQRIAADAKSLHRIVSVVSNGRLGTFTSMATHRSGALTIGVSAGGVPSAAARIRDSIAEKFDARYANALDALAAIRSGDSDWAKTNAEIGSDFCSRVERGEFDEASR